MTSSRAVGRCVRHRGHRDTEDTEEFRDFASTTLPTTDGRICCLAITAGAPRSARGLFVFTLSDRPAPRRKILLSKRSEGDGVGAFGALLLFHRLRRQPAGTGLHLGGGWPVRQ